MNTRPSSLVIALSLFAALARGEDKAPVPLAAEPFPLQQVRLLDGPFRDAMTRDGKYLLSLDADRLLRNFRVNAGLPSSARPYGGWESPTCELRGHITGHYLSACSLMYASTGDARFKERVDKIVAGLAECQAALAKNASHAGYLSAFPESFIDKVENQRPVWAPWYTLHKIMAGLLDAHQLCGSAQALEVLMGMADWVKFRVDALPLEQMQASLNTEFGGMNEVLANLYAITGNPDHLRLAQAFNQKSLFDPLARGEDVLDGKHANTQIPKMIGVARQFELTGDERDEHIAKFFWERVALHRSYVIGGHSDGEHFFPVSSFAKHLSAETCETCNTYNMLKLTRHLFEWQPDATDMDFYERALYNDILASQDPEQGMFVYLMSLKPGHFKTYSTPEDSFWCCVGTGMENHAKYGDTIYFHGGNSLYVNLFMPSELTWPEKHLVLRQETAFPEADMTRLTFKTEAPTPLALKIRWPGWSEKMSVRINGKTMNVSGAPGSYLTFDREWREGDRVEIRFSMNLHLEPLPGTTNMVAALYGPIVLAGELGRDGVPNQYAANQLDLVTVSDPAVPVMAGTANSFLKKVQPAAIPLTFHAQVPGQPEDITLAPFYKIADQRYTVYWKLDQEAGPPKITVTVNHPGHKISPLLWGIFFEDINLSADGGIYPELVRNRSFEDSDQPDFWKLSGGDSSMSIEHLRPLNILNPHYLGVHVDGVFTLENEGYWGMNMIQGDSYALKLAARGDGFNGPLTVKIIGSSGAELARSEITDSINNRWRYHTLELTASATDPKAKMQISGAGRGTLFLDMVSLLPKKTWKGHGLRVDLAEALDALHPAFMRFPGGNWIEGDDLAHMYHWKSTIGDIDARAPLWNTWGYNTTQGLGFYEYLQLCEDLGAEPLFDINCGMALGNKSVPLGQMGQWTQDALDAIEYANGPTNSVWGALRAQAGHPAPFHLKYMEIGNENGGPDYWQRWALLVDAIRAKYPYVKVIMNTSLSGYAYPPSPKPDLIDEHYYESPESFMRRASQYDKYDRQGPQIFVGEYAVTHGAGKGNLRAAIGEAAFMTGLERNSDVVALASYAPLFVNLNHRAWNPDLINFDSSRWYGLPSYYVQQLFSRNRGDVTLPITVETGESGETLPSGAVGVGTWNTAAEFKDIKVTAPDGKVLFASDFTRNTRGWKLLGDGGAWSVADGALRQGAEKEFIRAIAGDRSWKDYTVELKARKISGREGFMVYFHISDDDDTTRWNIGGWNNAHDAIQMDSNLDWKDDTIEDNRWYDLKVELRGRRIRCWLDGKLIHDIEPAQTATRHLYASAARDNQGHDVIVKVVNTAPVSVTVEIDLQGVKHISGPVRATVLTSPNSSDENSIDQPDRVVPVEDTFEIHGPAFRHAFPGNSLTVLSVRP